MGIRDAFWFLGMLAPNIGFTRVADVPQLLFDPTKVDTSEANSNVMQLTA